MCQGSSQFPAFLHHFVSAKLANSSIRLNWNMAEKIMRNKIPDSKYGQKLASDLYYYCAGAIPSENTSGSQSNIRFSPIILTGNKSSLTNLMKSIWRKHHWENI